MNGAAAVHEENPETMKFYLLEDPKIVLPVIEKRLPTSCIIYNTIIKYDSFRAQLKVYSLGKEINGNTWIVTNYHREDYGQTISISAPSAVVEGLQEISSVIKASFVAFDIIDWNEQILFCALEKRISSMIFDISVNLKGNVTEAHPCILYHMDRDEALKLEINHGSEIEVRKMNSDSKDDVQFFVSTWKYSINGTPNEFKKYLAGNASSGVFVNGKCASGVLIAGFGIVSALYTLKEFRGKGLAKLTMRYAFKEFAKEGCIPCDTVETRNEQSIKFHESLGVKAISIVDWIDVKKFTID